MRPSVSLDSLATDEEAGCRTSPSAGITELYVMMNYIYSVLVAPTQNHPHSLTVNQGATRYFEIFEFNRLGLRWT